VNKVEVNAADLSEFSIVCEECAMEDYPKKDDLDGAREAAKQHLAQCPDSKEVIISAEYREEVGR